MSPCFQQQRVLKVQHYAIKFCVHLKKNTEETILLLQKAFGNEVLGVLMIKGGIKYSWMAESWRSFNQRVGSRKLCAKWWISIPLWLPLKTTIISQYKPSLQNWKSVRNCWILNDELGIFKLLFPVGICNHTLAHLVVSQQIS